MDVPMADAGMSFDYSLIWWLILLGVASGVYSLYYSYIMKLIERWLTRLRYPLLRNVVGGLIVGVGVMFFPSVIWRGVWGCRACAEWRYQFRGGRWIVRFVRRCCVGVASGDGYDSCIQMFRYLGDK